MLRTISTCYPAKTIKMPTVKRRAAKPKPTARPRLRSDFIKGVKKTFDETSDLMSDKHRDMPSVSTKEFIKMTASEKRTHLDKLLSRSMALRGLVFILVLDCSLRLGLLVWDHYRGSPLGMREPFESHSLDDDDEDELEELTST